LLIAAIVCAAPSLAAEQAQLDSSVTLFSVMAAVAGAEAPDAPADELRAAVRKFVQEQKPAVLPDLRSFFRQHRQADPAADLSQYISFALSSDQPPTFASNFEGGEVPPDVQELSGFRDLMVSFHEQANIDDLWRRVQPAYEEAIARYHEPVTRAILETNGYLRNPTSGYMGRRFLVYVDLLAPANAVHTRSYKDDYFIVVTPSAQPRIDDIRHSYLHYLLDPLFIKYAERVNRAQGLSDYAMGVPVLEDSYKADFLLLATESLIKAMEARLDRKPDDVRQAVSEGFVLAPYFYESLPAYEKQAAAMRMYLPDMLDAIDLKKEDRRLAQVTFAQTKTVKRAERMTPAPAPVLNSSQRSLESAEKLYANRNLDGAREEYLKLVQQTDDKSVHARAYYGLARIAALKNDPESAEQLFRKTLELSPDPHTLSWTEVYLARLAEGFGEREEAARHYRAALGVQGAPPGAREAAEQGLKKNTPQ
jgi:tetratricopeptide (TPR) repeat protein